MEMKILGSEVGRESREKESEASFPWMLKSFRCQGSRYEKPVNQHLECIGIPMSSRTAYTETFSISKEKKQKRKGKLNTKVVNEGRTDCWCREG